MEELLKKIIAIEKDAQQIVGEAREERDRFDRDIAAHVQKIRQEMAHQTESQISAMQEAERSSTSGKIAQLRSQTQQRIQQMDALLEQNKAHWSEQIFANVLKR